jgi:hypothetical protein
VDAAFMSFKRNAAWLKFIVGGRRCVSRPWLLVLLRSCHAAVTRDACPPLLAA